MKCLKCGHMIPDKANKCLYCGARTPGETSSEMKKEPSETTTSFGEGGKDVTAQEAAKKEINYKKLEELPLSLRAKVEEMLKMGDGNKEEIKRK